MARAVKPWSPHEEARLLLSWMIQPKGLCARHAGDHRRSSRSVRMKLHRLLSNPDTAPPSFRDAVDRYRATGAHPAAPPDAAAPRVQPARGPDSTPDKND